MSTIPSTPPMCSETSIFSTTRLSNAERSILTPAQPKTLGLITFSATPRAFFGMVSKRLCRKTQGEFVDVAKQMAEQVYEKVDPRLKRWIGPPCQFGKCQMEGENYIQAKQNQLTGSQNTQHVCGIYMDKFYKGVTK